MNNLKTQIREKELMIQIRKRLIHNNYELLKDKAEQKLTSPLFLTLAFFTGYTATHNMLVKKTEASVTTKPTQKIQKKISYAELGTLAFRLINTYL